jgi:hypothetical protein
MNVSKKCTTFVNLFKLKLNTVTKSPVAEELAKAGPATERILSQFHPSHTLTTHISKTALVLFSHIPLGLPSDRSPRDFLTRSIYCLFHPCLCHIYFTAKNAR